MPERVFVRQTDEIQLALCDLSPGHEFDSGSLFDECHKPRYGVQ